VPANSASEPASAAAYAAAARARIEATGIGVVR
jgi:hypothetical protein